MRISRTKKVIKRSRSQNQKLIQVVPISTGGRINMPEQFGRKIDNQKSAVRHRWHFSQTFPGHPLFPAILFILLIIVFLTYLPYFY